MYTDYNTYYATNNFTGMAVWTVISVILAIGGGIALYFLFIKKDKKYDGILAKLHSFLNFKTMLIEDILKLSYLILALYITLFSFGLIGISIMSFIVVLIIGNIALRITYELSILLIKICKNTSEINSKLKK